MVFIIAIGFLLIHGKVESHMILNAYHTPLLDTFFKYFTQIGGWVPCAIAGVLLLFKKWRVAVVILAAQLIATIITSPIKRIIRAPRPSVILSELGIDFPHIEGVDLHTTLSFPSGHTSAAFALCACLAAIIPAKYRWLQLALVLFGWLGAYSRIYLSQHFVDDVLAGSVIGVFSAGLMYVVLFQKEWGNQPLFPLHKK
jgi:membrane-associated phospholipid phosphatase